MTDNNRMDSYPNRNFKITGPQAHKALNNAIRVSSAERAINNLLFAQGGTAEKMHKELTLKLTDLIDRFDAQLRSIEQDARRTSRESGRQGRKRAPTSKSATTSSAGKDASLKIASAPTKPNQVNSSTSSEDKVVSGSSKKDSTKAKTNNPKKSSLSAVPSEAKPQASKS